MDRVVFFCALLVSATSLVCNGQSFSTRTGRNHPEIDWKVATTEHFEIIHPAHLDGIAAKAAPIAETTYDTLSATLDTTFSDRIRVYLGDQDAIVNGFAVPFGTGYTNIWVHTNDWASSFTGPSKWLRLVLAHELVHIFHYRATKGDFGIWERLFWGFPRFWTEGLAQYQAETWNAQRGERWLRAAVLDDALSYEDGRSLWNVRLLYASGHSQMRYFAQQYGDSTLTDLLHHRTDAVFGLGSVHDFEDAFQSEAGLSYETFYEEWLRDVNVYYNTLAGQLETLDSMRTDTLSLPGRYIHDIAYSPDTSRIAVLSDLSPERPVRHLSVIDRSTGERTVVSEGPIEPSFSWRADGEQIVFSRQTRAEHGSIVDDLFVVGADGDDERRLTYGRRTSAPTYGPAGDRIAFVATEGGTANVYVLNPGQGRMSRATPYTDDVQITGLQWHPHRDTLAFARVGPDAERELVLYDLDADSSTALTNPETDDRRPVWRPSGTAFAYTSLRDGVPNAFVYDLEEDKHRRVTHLTRGATVHDWVPADSAFVSDSTQRASDEALVTSTVLSKDGDGAFRIPAHRTGRSVDPTIPAPYSAWTTTEPPRTIPSSIDPDPSLIRDRTSYTALSNLTHRGSLVLPYYASPGNFGIQGGTSWTEPLGKHTINAGGGVSFTEPGTKSEVVATYLNRQLYPTIGVSVFSASSSARIYGRDLLVEDRTGGEVSVRWPLDWRVRPYVSTRVSVRLRYADLEPVTTGALQLAPTNLAPPEAGQQASLRLQFLRRKNPPYRHGLIHPLDGWGLRLRTTGAAPVLGGDSSFLRGDLAGYRLLPSVGRHRLFLFGRLQAQTGSSFAQDYLGFSRYDAIDLPLPGGVPVTLGDAERVRGHRTYVLGNRVAFGSIEYRMPLVPSLQTEVLGLVELGHTTLSAFVDGGIVWSGQSVGESVRQAGTGLELKNALRLGGFRIGQAAGVAQPLRAVGTRDEIRLYYRVQTGLPF